MIIPYWSSATTPAYVWRSMKPADDPRAVERRDRKQVEDAEHDVHVQRVDDDLLGRPRKLACCQIAPNTIASTKLVTGPAMPTSAMPRWGAPAQVARVDRHGLGPAEQEAAAQ